MILFGYLWSSNLSLLLKRSLVHVVLIASHIPEETDPPGRFLASGWLTENMTRWGSQQLLRPRGHWNLSPASPKRGRVTFYQCSISSL